MQKKEDTNADLWPSHLHTHAMHMNPPKHEHTLHTYTPKIKMFVKDFHVGVQK